MSEQWDRRVLADLVAATAASSFAAPFVAAMDTAITKHAAGTHGLLASLKEELAVLCRRPDVFVASVPCRWLFGLFFCTYGAANLADTCSRARGGSSSTAVLGASTAANMSRRDAQCYPRVRKMICIDSLIRSVAMAKDAAFAKMYRPSSMKVARPAPPSMFACFFVRDLVCMAAFFTLPPQLSAELQAVGATKVAADTASQFALPVLVQLPASPWHLLGLHLYNSPTATPRERLFTIWRQMGPTVAARMARIVPAFSVGGTLNRRLREAWT